MQARFPYVDRAHPTSEVACHRVFSTNLNQFQCNYCNGMFDTNQHWEIHYYHYHLGLPDKCLFDPCTFRYSIICHLWPHIQFCHSDKICCFCDICQMIFYFAPDFTYHMREYHSTCSFGALLRRLPVLSPNELVPEATFTCSQCIEPEFMCFSDAYKLLDHYKKEHPPPPVYFCPLCDKKFNSAGILGHHKLLHYAARHFKCGKCGEQFHTRQEFMDHRKQSHPEDFPFRCEICNDVFNVRVLLDHHVERCRR